MLLYQTAEPVKFELKENVLEVLSTLKKQT